MKVLLTVLLLLHANAAFKPPTIDVEDHQVQEHGSIGRFVELEEHDDLVLKCAGRFDDLKFAFPKMDEHVGYNEEDFQNRIEEYVDEGFGDTILTIKDVRESDTGTYSCVSEEHASLNDTIHVFVHGSKIFLPLKSVAYIYNEGEVMVPCKTTKFIDKSDIELFANDGLIKSASKNYDQRYGYKLIKKMNDAKPIENVRFECRFRKDPSQEVDFLISETSVDDDEGDFKFFWEKGTDWPHVGYNYTITCHLTYSGPSKNFGSFQHTLHVDCPQCSQDIGSHAFADRHRLSGTRISATIRISNLTLADSGPYKCVWQPEYKEKKEIVETIDVAPNKAQIKILERSPQILRMKEGHPISLSAQFAVYPLDGDNYKAVWGRLYNSSIKEGLQSETISNDKHRTIVTSDSGKGAFSEKLDISGDSVKTDMSGTYVLTISHLGTVQVIQWEVAIENTEPVVLITIREPSSFILFNQSFYPSNYHLHVDCVSISIPPTEVFFEKRSDRNSEFHPIDSNQLTQVGGTYENGYIYNLTLENNIELKCSSQRHGKNFTTTKMIIVADGQPTASSFVNKSSSATESEKNLKGLFEGDDVTLVCTVPNGATDLDVSWRLDDKVLMSEVRDDPNSNHSKHYVLHLKDVTYQSSGTYKCYVQSKSTKGGKPEILEKHVIVEKTEKPYHTRAESMTSIKVHYDKNFELDCNLAGNPPPVYQWYKDGRPYTHGDVDGTVLRVTRARAEDEGQFHCLATNRAGSTDNFFRVHVKGAPKGSWLPAWPTAFAILLFLGISIILGYKLYGSKKISKQKDIALSELHEALVRTHNGPLPEDMKDQPIDQLVYYLPYNTEFEIAGENLEILDVLGTGNFGIVRKGLLSMADPKSQIEYKTKLPVAVKMSANRYDIAQQKMLADELKVMCAIGRHPNVLSLVGAVTRSMRKGQLFIVTELVECGNLCHYLTERRSIFKNELVEDDDADEEPPVDESYMVPNSAKKKKYTFNKNGERQSLLGENKDTLCSSDLISFSMQIANGMEYLATVPCVHRDLACRNILLTKSKIVRIGDFGLAKKYEDKQYYRTKNSKDTPVPIRWMPLESILNQKFTEKSDVWSFGICLYEIFTLGGLPYPGIESTKIVDYVKQGNINSQPEYCHDEIYKLMKMCWYRSSAERPTFSECVQFFKRHMIISANRLLEHVDDMLRLEKQHQAELEDWIRPSRPDIPGSAFQKPAKKPQDQRYLVVDAHE
ncbi:unnamed protein product [Caenorhabditis sp. 36 PRJEB53466]|nr:unnamed protein product [Caenorhabditis sp. 36 PRJEB53466]